MIHDLSRKPSSSVTVSMETDEILQAFKLIGFDFRARKREQFASVHICGVSNNGKKKKK